MTEPSQSERITVAVRDDILRGRYRQGDRLPSERDLSESFQVHRGAVREALKKLEQLGLADIQPGGARVAPIDEASLEVVGHLLEVENPPDLGVVDQVLEVFSGLFAMAARLGVERADEAQIARARQILAQLSDPLGDAGEQHDLFHELGHLFVDASHNMVLKLVRRGLKTRFMERLQRDVLAVRAPASIRVPLTRRLATAVECRDGAAASEAMYQMMVTIRQHALEALEEERAPQVAEQVAPGRER